MKVVDNNKTIKLQFKNAVSLQQTCKIYLAIPDGSSWSFYFQKGALIWASSSIHRFRRLHRITNQIVPEINCQDIRLREQEISELWEYLLISVLCQRKQITIVQAQEIIQEIIKEVLIDCFLFSDRISQTKTIFETKGNTIGAVLRSPLFKEPITKIDYKNAISSLEIFVSDWKNIQFDNCLPNSAPVIKNIDKLSKAIKLNNNQQLFSSINGKRTLRDLACITKQDLISLTSSLTPHIKNKAIALQEIPDRQLANLYFSLSNSDNAKKYKNQTRTYIRELDLPLVLVVDDKPKNCQKITQILNPAGYQVISVSDAAKALIVLLENQPDLIILDGVMPDANGYELCTQIRQMPDVKDIPIILLHNKESMINKVKAKMSGASDSIDKPVKAKDILMLVQKHTQNFVD